MARGGDRVGTTRSDGDFSAFFHATWPRLFRTTYAVAGDAATAEDALQSAFAKAYASWRKVSSTEHPEAYVRRMAVNEVLGLRRRAFFRREHANQDLRPEPSSSHEAHVDDRAVVWRAVSQLPPRQRAVIVLRYYEGLSEAEIAEVLGCSRGTVKSQASDALRRLRVHATTGELS